MPAADSLWCALFLQAASPGQVFRWIERRFSRGEVCLEALGLLLSDAVPPEGWRALVGGEEAVDWMQGVGPAFSEAFPPAVILLWGDRENWFWEYVVWESGREIDRRRVEVTRPTLLQRLLGTRLWGTATAAQAGFWARNLPLERIPAFAGRRPLSVHSYSTIEGLDQRGLLIENSPRLYRFTFASGSETQKPGD